MLLAVRLSEEEWLVNRIESSNSGGSFAPARSSARPNPNDWNPRCCSPARSHSEYSNPEIQAGEFRGSEKWWVFYWLALVSMIYGWFGGSDGAVCGRCQNR